jgi:predicted RNase H-like nuclease (RuvC/YqgF family)
MRAHKQSKKIVAYLKALIEKGDLDQITLKKKLPGVTQQAINAWITGKSGPTKENVLKLKKIFPEIDALLDQYDNIEDTLSSTLHDDQATQYLSSNIKINQQNEQISALMLELQLKDRLLESMEREISTLREWLREHRDRTQPHPLNPIVKSIV